MNQEIKSVNIDTESHKRAKIIGIEMNMTIKEVIKCAILMLNNDLEKKGAEKTIKSLIYNGFLEKED